MFECLTQIVLSDCTGSLTQNTTVYESGICRSVQDLQDILTKAIYTMWLGVNLTGTIWQIGLTKRYGMTETARKLELHAHANGTCNDSC